MFIAAPFVTGVARAIAPIPADEATGPTLTLLLLDGVNGSPTVLVDRYPR